MAGHPNPFTEKVILHTLQKSALLDKFHHVFTDQFYIKFLLLRSFSTATINKKSRFLSKTVMAAQLGAWEGIYFRKEDLVVGFRHKANRKPVNLLKTVYHAEDVHVRSRKGLEGNKPIVIQKYKLCWN